MYQPLAPCPSCSRHIKTTEKTCPFCKGALTDSHADAAIPGATGRLTRAAAFAFTASLAVAGSTAACTSGVAAPNGGDASADGSTPPRDEGGVQAAYGGPGLLDSSAPDATAPDATAPDDSGGGGAKYGGPPIDSGK